MARIGPIAAQFHSGGSNEETLLVDCLRGLEENPAGAYAVHLHLSELRKHHRKTHFIRIAARTFEDLIANHDAALFRLYNSDLVLVCRDVSVNDIDGVLYKVRALFNEDPLTADDDGSLEDRFSTWYDLSRSEDYEAMFATAQELESFARLHHAQEKDFATAVASKSMAGQPLKPGNLSEINHKIAEVRLNDLIRNQTAVEIHPGGRGEVLFQENYISMADLQKRVAPDINFFDSTWLFQYLTETLDKRMLTILAGMGIASRKDPASINLNIRSVLSREFQNFHRIVGGKANKLVIEMQLIDIFSDMGAFMYARESLQERGYRVLIDGLSPLSLQFFDPGLLKADYVKINWGPEFIGEVPEKRMVEMRDVVKHTGNESVILARVDSEEAVKWGLSLGINRFQGHYIDKVVDAMIAKKII